MEHFLSARTCIYIDQTLKLGERVLVLPKLFLSKIFRFLENFQVILISKTDTKITKRNLLFLKNFKSLSAIPKQGHKYFCNGRQHFENNMGKHLVTRSGYM